MNLTATKPLCVLVLGDSWASGNKMQAPLLKRLPPCSHVVTIGRSGATASELLNLVDDAANYSPDVCLVIVGVNDVLRHTGTKRFGWDCAELAKALRVRGIVPVFAAIAPFDWRYAEIELPFPVACWHLLKAICQPRYPDPVRAYNDAARAALPEDITIVDTSALDGALTHGLWQGDGIHLTLAGQHALAGLIAAECHSPT